MSEKEILNLNLLGIMLFLMQRKRKSIKSVIRNIRPTGCSVTMSVWKTIRITCYAKRFLTVSERLSRTATAAKAKAAIGI